MIEKYFTIFIVISIVLIFSYFMAKVISVAIEMFPYSIESNIYNDFVNTFSVKDLEGFKPTTEEDLNCSKRDLLVSIATLCIFILFVHDVYFFFAILGFTYILFTLAAIDIKTRYLPDMLNFSLLWVGVLMAMFDITNITLQESLLGVMIGYIGMSVVAFILGLFKGKGVICKGDYKLLAAIGAWCGYEPLTLILLIAIIFAVIFNSVMIKLDKKTKDESFAFGQYIALSGWLITVNSYLI